MSIFVFTDVDGTLFSHHQKGIPASALNAIQEARKNNHKVFISSGRGIHMMKYDDFNFELDGYVLCNGSHVIVDGKDVYVEFMNENDIHELLDFLVDNQIGFLFEGYHCNYLYGLGIERISNFERSSQHKELSDEEALASLASHQVFNFNEFKGEYHECVKMNVYFKNQDEVNLVLQSLPENLKPIYDKNDAVKSIEIIAKGNSKATGMDKILEYYHSIGSTTLALGDGKNDLEMIQHASISIAMGNANELLKEHATYVTSHIDEDGFMEAFKEFELIK